MSVRILCFSLMRTVLLSTLKIECPTEDPCRSKIQKLLLPLSLLLLRLARPRERMPIVFSPCCFPSPSSPLAPLGRPDPGGAHWHPGGGRMGDTMRVDGVSPRGCCLTPFYNGLTWISANVICTTSKAGGNIVERSLKEWSQVPEHSFESTYNMWKPTGKRAD